MKRVAIAAVLAVTAVGAGVASSSSSAATTGHLTGTVGPSFTITLSQHTVKAGTYTITVKDLSPIHNFHLFGKGVNKTTSVSGKGTVTWKVTLKKGTYTYQCDPHNFEMIGKLRVT